MVDVLTAPDDTKDKPKPDSGPNWDRIYSAVGLPSKDKLAADDDKIAALETKAPVLTPMPPKEPQTDPLQAFGQPAFWIAAIGSLLTRSHLTAAIQSAGAVVSSTKQQDQAITQRHYDEWKVNTENALKMAKYEQDAYKAALARKGVDVRESEAELRAVATSAKNAGLLKALDEEGMAGAARYVEAHRKGIQGIEDGASGFGTHYEQLLKAQAQRAEWSAWLQANPYATPQQAAKAKLDIAEGRDPFDTSAKEYAAPQEIEVTNEDGTKTKILAQQDKRTHGWVTADESLTPIQAHGGTMRIVKEGPEAKLAAPGSAAADRAAIAEGVKRDHPDWTEDKQAEEVERRMKAADTAPHAPAPGSAAEIQVTIEKDLKATHPDWTDSHIAMEASHLASDAKQPVISDDAAKIAADVALKTGHPPAWMGRSSGSLTKFLDAYSAEAKAQGIGANEIASNIVKFSGEMAEARTLGTATARIDLAARELDVALPQALELSDKVYRPGFKSLAAIQQAAQGETSDPDLLEFAQQNQQVMNAYALSMSRGGVSTVSSMERAAHLLSTATSQAGYMRQLDRLHKEVQTVLYGTAAAKQGLINEITGGTQQVPPPTLSGVQRAKPESMSDGQILDAAKRKISEKPDLKQAVIDQLRAWGIDSDGL